MSLPWDGIFAWLSLIGANFVMVFWIWRVRMAFDRLYPGRRMQLNLDRAEFITVMSPFRQTPELDAQFTQSERDFLGATRKMIVGLWGALLAMGVIFVIRAVGKM